jgi:uncharacterized protein YjdB
MHVIVKNSKVVNISKTGNDGQGPRDIKFKFADGKATFEAEPFSMYEIRRDQK